MLYLIRSDETIEELPSAATGEIEGHEFVCRDEQGTVVGRYPRLDIVMFGYNDRVRALVEKLRALQRDRAGA